MERIADLFMNGKRAIFFDRDGVLNKDIDLAVSIDQIIIPQETFLAFKRLATVECLKIVVSNQTVVCRGMATEKDVERINQHVSDQIFLNSGCRIDKFYFCPHHPEATLEKYRLNCECRKPKPGMLKTAASEFGISLPGSWMIGDRISDVIAGSKAMCNTILLQTGMHEAKPIISDGMDLSVVPDFVCENLIAAVERIIYKWNENV
jgi:D,D-heptose 1,7-bisphosphate phosphatase